MAYDDYGNYIDENQYGYSDPYGQNSAQNPYGGSSPNAPVEQPTQSLDQQVAALPTPPAQAPAPLPPESAPLPPMATPQPPAPEPAPIQSIPSTPESAAPMPYDEYGNYTDPNGNQGPPPPLDPMQLQTSQPPAATPPAPQLQALPPLNTNAPADYQTAAPVAPVSQPLPPQSVATTPESGQGGGYPAPQTIPAPELTPYNPPAQPQLQDVGTDPFSQQLEGGISNIISSGGQSQSPTGQSLDAAIQSLLANGGRLGSGESDAQRASRFESLRQPIDMGANTMMNELMGELANRGQAGSGMQDSSIMNLYANKIAPQFATALQQSGTALDAQMGNESVSRLGQALGAGQSVTGQESGNVQGAINSGTQRQQMLSEVALQNLDQNRQWNQFLAEYGLNRDMALNMMQSGQVNQLMQLFQSYLALAQHASGGFV